MKSYRLKSTYFITRIYMFMCGIIGKIGNNAVETVLENLKKIEYLGCDSAGILFTNKQSNIFEITKDTGGIDNLSNTLRQSSKTKQHTAKKSTMCIGHTRWATHGSVSIKNAHPHLSQSGYTAVAHNGIVENHAKLLEFINSVREKPLVLKSQTDSEIIPNLFDHFLGNPATATCPPCLTRAMKQTLGALNGSLAFILTCTRLRNTFLVAKKGRQPMFVSIKRTQTADTPDIVASSDVNTALSHGGDLYSLDSDEFAVVRPAGTLFYDTSGRVIEKSQVTIDKKAASHTKGKFDTYLEKEINETPEVIEYILEKYKAITETAEYQKVLGKITSSDFGFMPTLHFAGCGTAYHAGLMTASLFEKHLGIPTKSYIASELPFVNPVVKKCDIGIVISQSGETADTLLALDEFKKRGIYTISICNADTSSIARSADYNLPCFAGVEKSVASTKAFIAQVVVGLLLANNSFKRLFDKPLWQFSDFDTLSELARGEIAKSNEIEKIAKSYASAKNIFILGKSHDHINALEGALKVKEITYIPCEGFPSGELKHGTLSLVTDETLTIVIDTAAGDSNYPAIKSKLSNATSEVTTRGSHFWFPNAGHRHPLYFSIGTIPVQLFALYLSKAVGNNPDKPRNLAKSVTVE